MEWRNIGESLVIRYCGPMEKFVSWAALIPVRTNSKQSKLASRIRASVTVYG
jgi:hypothetical protein